MNSIVVVAVSVDTQYIILFDKDGGTVTLPQGDPRVTRIMEAVTPALSMDPPHPVEVSLETVKTKLEIPEFGEAEKASNGLIRFFRVAKKRITEWFGDSEPTAPVEVEPEDSPHVKPQTLGKVPTAPGLVEGEQVKSVEPKPVPVVVKTNEQKLVEANARLDILTGEGVPTSDPKFSEELSADETIVAVTGTTIIPDAQHLNHQIKAANSLQDYEGFRNFLERLGKVIEKRLFSVEDLMKFMKHADLPIADDGSIVIYKRLERRTDKDGTYFVDCHTKKVKQRVGSHVFMDESLVDPSRRADCSHGLHVAALSYLSGFSGDVTIIGKVGPEDVIAVPEYSNNKMRVAAYDILFELTQEQASKVNRGGKLSDALNGKEVLNAVLRGKHKAIDQLVKIGGSYGTKLEITDLEIPEDATVTELKPEDLRNTNLENVGTGAEVKAPESAPVKAADLKPVINSPENLTPVKQASRSEIAKQLWDTYRISLNSDHLRNLETFKKATKSSWSKLGFSAEVVELIKTELAKLEPVTKVETVTDFDNVKEKPAKAIKAKPGMVKGAGSPRQQIRDVLNDGELDEGKANRIVKLKKSAKKGWSALGVSDDEVKTILAKATH